MVYRAVYTLKVLHQPEEESCSFLLLWKGGQRDIYVGETFPRRLVKNYETWQKHYLRYYRLQPKTGIQNSGSISIAPTGDRSQDLRTAEDAFLTTFFRWLGEGAVRKIEQQLQSALIELSQSMTVNGNRDRGAGTTLGTAENTPSLPYQVDLYLACDDVKIQQFPWEQWVVRLVPENIPVGAIRLIRTTKDGVGKQQWDVPLLRLKKTRILAILGDDPQLPVHEDWEKLKALKKIATVERATWNANASPTKIIQTVFNYIQDDRGWDVLFFAGHSDDVSNRSGTFKLAPNVTLAMNDLEEQLEQARQNGLQVAIFNSCSGLRIADSLVRYGIQSVVMREPIRSDAALRFLKYLTQHLLEFKDIHTATLRACGQMRSRDRIGIPSAYLLPSFFSPPSQQPFRIRTIGWKHRLKRWLPSRREGITLGFIFVLSQMVPIQDLVLDLRHFSQAIYRHATQQGIAQDTMPPVQVIAINQASINQVLKTDDYPEFTSNPIDRLYLSHIIDDLISLNAKTIGVDYLIRERKPKQEFLEESIQDAIDNHQVLFVFADDPDEGLTVHPDLADPSQSLRGTIKFDPWIWTVALPSDKQCSEYCPFAYLTALSYHLNKTLINTIKNKNFESNSDNNIDLRTLILGSIHKEDEQFYHVSHMHPRWWQWKGKFLVDFSLPPANVYQRTSSGTLLDEGLSNADLSTQVILIGAGAYQEVDPIDKYALPLATRYWRNMKARSSDQEFPAVMTGVEVQAYMTHHLLKGHLVAYIPVIWMLGLAAILGRTVTFHMLEQPATNRQKKILILMIVGAGIMSLQLYILARIAIPWLFPSCLFLTYTLPIFRRTNHA